MSVEERKAYFEWLDKDLLKITTPYRQQVFSFTPSDDSTSINLINFEKGPICKWRRGQAASTFFAEVFYDEPYDVYYVDVIAETSEDKWKAIGCLQWPQKPDCFKVAVRAV